MRASKGLLGASLLFWGWEIGHLYLAAAAALALEASPLVKSRLALSKTDFQRISDLCTLLFLGLFIYFYASHGAAKAVLGLLQWLPLILFPLLMAQVYSRAGRIEISSLFLIIRKKEGESGNRRSRAVDLTYLYFGLSILSASAVNVKGPWFYTGAFALAAWALWPLRSRRYSPILWMILFAGIGLAGYTAQLGLHGLQTVLENNTVNWFSRLGRDEADPHRAQTAIGELGTLKLSDRILFRVEMDSSDRGPLLLREATYNAYRSSTWFSSRSRFKALKPEADGSTWKLAEGPPEGEEITVSMPLRRGKGMLKCPAGTFEIGGLPGAKMARNQFGDLKVEEGPGLINYQIGSSSLTPRRKPPNDKDLSVPREEMPSLERTLQELEIPGKSPEEVLETLDLFFRNNFEYSLVSKKEGNMGPPIGVFLTRTRSGHCEYFASATVLLLRAAGIPARYVTGYSVEEFSNLEKRFVVRSRHAHAWALVYRGGAWDDFDTTPPSWSKVEEAEASILEPIFDFWSWWIFNVLEWRWRQVGGGVAKYMVWPMIPLVIILVLWLRSRHRIKPPQREEVGTAGAAIIPGLDSEFYLIEKRLMELGYGRYPWETLKAWLKRIEVQGLEHSTEPLQSILELHYRYRFDPKSITSGERSALKIKIETWLKKRS